METTNNNTVVETKILGRKINPDSARQKRLAELAEKAAKGELKRGRPIVGTSARQLRLAELAEKAAKGELKRGRPVSSESERQKKLAEKAAKLASGEVIKRGRPAMPKVETPPTENA